MSSYIIDLFDISTWELIFSVAFFLGLIFTIYIIIGAWISSETHSDSDVDHDMQLDGDHELNLETTHHLELADHEPTIDMDHDLDLDTDQDFNLDTDDLVIDHELGFDHDLSGDIHSIDVDIDQGSFNISDLQIDDVHDVGTIKDQSYELKSNFMMGNISIFLLFWGQTGWMNIHNLNDLTFGYSILIGFIASRIFSLIIQKYAKTVIVPIVYIQKGDIAEVVYSVSQSKAGLVNVRKRDGSIEPVMAKGAFPHDNFDRADKGYIIGKLDSFYLLTRGHGELSHKKVLLNNKGKPMK